MRHHQNLTRVGRAFDETMFFQGMIRVRKSIRKWIAKNRLSFFERDAVLNKITRCFLLVPCKAHGGTIAALSLCLPLNQRSNDLFDGWSVSIYCDNDEALSRCARAIPHII